jgi:hypothetical protein
MNIYQKLQEARVLLQKMELKKTGNNKFAGYKYFELGDYLPAIQVIFNEVGLCGIVTFDNEMAYLTIYEFDGEGKIIITSPMSTALLKGSHPIQNLGAVQTYLRRYLWQSAMEIVEHDAIDASTGKESLQVEPEKKITPKKEVEPNKPPLLPNMVKAWNNAKAAYKRDGNFDSILQRYSLSTADKTLLMQECDSADTDGDMDDYDDDVPFRWDHNEDNK